MLIKVTSRLGNAGLRRVKILPNPLEGEIVVFWDFFTVGL
jgi:hypothetical protein